MASTFVPSWRQVSCINAASCSSCGSFVKEGWHWQETPIQSAHFMCLDCVETVLAAEQIGVLSD